VTTTIPYNPDDLFSSIAQHWTRAEWQSFLNGEIYDQIFLEEEQEPLRELLIQADYTLMEEESIDTILTRIKYPRSHATWGGEVRADPVTLPKAQKSHIEAYVLRAKSRWDFNTAKSSVIRSREDAAATAQMVAKENELIIRHIYSLAGPLARNPDNPGAFTLDDLIGLETKIKVSDSQVKGREGEGGRMTHVLCHPNEIELLQKDERVLNKITEVSPSGKPIAERSPAEPSKSGAQFYKIEGRSWWICSSNYSTPNEVRAWDYYNYLVHNIKMEMQINPYDETPAGIGDDKGNRFLSMMGFGKEPFADSYVCSMTIGQAN